LEGLTKVVVCLTKLGEGLTTEKRVLQGLEENVTRVKGRTNKNIVEFQELGEGLTRT
jgi:hypothetical protein